MGPSTGDLVVLCLRIGMLYNPWPLLMMEGRR